MLYVDHFSSTLVIFIVGWYYRPVRIHMDIDSNMKMIGKRYPYLVQYQVHTCPLL